MLLLASYAAARHTILETLENEVAGNKNRFPFWLL